MSYELRIAKFYGGIAFIVLVAIDKFSKYLIRLRQLADGGFYICNQNISWSIAIPGYVFWTFWTTLIVLLLVAIKNRYFIHSTSYMILILAGAISNIIDRLYYVCVIDFIDLRFWPVFNLADIFIVSGVVFLLVEWKKI